MKHILLMGDSQLHAFYVEHEERQREGARHRLVAQLRKTEKAQRETRTPVRGFIPRIAGALGLF